MRLRSVVVENFRCYDSPIKVQFDDLTALVGRNDIGKSSLLEALAIFFEEAKPDKDDACKSGDPSAMRIACEFDRLPESLVVDTDFPTTLADEYLLSASGTLIIQKTYNGAAVTPKVSAVEAFAEHPSSEGYNDLLRLKRADLIQRAEQLGVNLNGVDRRANAPIRAAIWASCDDLQLTSSAVPLDAEGSKQIWGALQVYLPKFALFKSDRSSTDQDAEAQDPLNAAVREAIAAVEEELLRIKQHVEAEVKKIADATVAKLKEMDASVADTLNPVVTTKKWDSLFSTSITGDEGIPLNKRGSGVKRLVLLNFFRAKAEKEASGRGTGSVIYAIEEPETSQHPRNQRLLLNALRDLSSIDGRQVIITTHTPMLARCLPNESIRFISLSEDGARQVRTGSNEVAPEVAKSLGVLPDNSVRIFVGVEGPHDINFLKNMSRVLSAAGEDVIDIDKLELDGEIIFVPLGGSNLALWASRLAPLGRPELHFCDRDNAPPAEPKYAQHMRAVNERENCRAIATEKREMENYLHPEAVLAAYLENGVEINLPNEFEDFDDVPEIVAKALYLSTAEEGAVWDDLDESNRKRKIRRAKSSLNSLATQKMTAELLTAVDPDGDVRGWFEAIAEMLNVAGE